MGLALSALVLVLAASTAGIVMATSDSSSGAVGEPAAAAQQLPALLPHKDGLESFVLMERTGSGEDQLTEEQTPLGTMRTHGGGQMIALPVIRNLPARPAIRFPAGVSYAQALRDLYVARQRGKELPPGAVLDTPLPAGTAVLIDDGAISVDSAAPFGYEPTDGRITSPTYSMPGSLDHHELDRQFQEAYDAGEVLPKSATINADPLPRCQVAYGRDDPKGTGNACFAAGAQLERIVPQIP